MELMKRVCKKSSVEAGNKAGRKTSKEPDNTMVKIRNLSRKCAKQQQATEQEIKDEKQRLTGNEAGKMLLGTRKEGRQNYKPELVNNIRKRTQKISKELRQPMC